LNLEDPNNPEPFGNTFVVSAFLAQAFIISFLMTMLLHQHHKIEELVNLQLLGMPWRVSLFSTANREYFVYPVASLAFSRTLPVCRCIPGRALSQEIMQSQGSGTAGAKQALANLWLPPRSCVLPCRMNRHEFVFSATGGRHL